MVEGGEMTYNHWLA